MSGRMGAGLPTASTDLCVLPHRKEAHGDKGSWVETAGDIDIVERFRDLQNRHRSDHIYKVLLREIEFRLLPLLLDGLSYRQAKRDHGKRSEMAEGP